MPTPVLSPYAARGRSSYRAPTTRGDDSLRLTTGLPSTPTPFTACGWFVLRDASGTAWQALLALEDGVSNSGNQIILGHDGAGNLGGYFAPSTVTFGTDYPADVPFFMAVANGSAGCIGYARRYWERTFQTVSTSQVSGWTPAMFSVCGNSWAYESENANAWNVRAWTRQLTAEELLRESYATFPDPKSLFGWWPLEGNLNQLVLDFSGNGRHLSLRGTASRAERFFLPASVLVPLVDDGAVDAPAGGIDLAGTAAGQATPAGALSITAQLVAASLGISTPAGTLSVALNPAGAVLGAAVVAGALALEVPLAASAQAVAQTAGALGVVKPLAGVSAGLAAINGTLSVSSGAALDGAAAGAAQVVGALDLLKPLSGNSLGQAAVAADLQAIRALAGGAAGAAGVTGGLSLAIAFNGAALGQAFVQGALQIEGAVDLAGAAQGAVTVQGALDKLAALSAAAGGEADVRATLALTLNLSGTAGGQAVGAGTLLVQGGISGAALAEAIAAGSLTLAVNMSGAALGQALVGAFFGAPQWAGTTLVPGLSIYHLSPHVDVAGDDLDVRIDYLEPRVAAQLAYV